VVLPIDAEKERLQSKMTEGEKRQTISSFMDSYYRSDNYASKDIYTKDYPKDNKKNQLAIQKENKRNEEELNMREEVLTKQLIDLGGEKKITPYENRKDISMLEKNLQNIKKEKIRKGIDPAKYNLSDHLDVSGRIGYDKEIVNSYLNGLEQGDPDKYEKLDRQVRKGIKSPTKEIEEIIIPAYDAKSRELENDLVILDARGDVDLFNRIVELEGELKPLSEAEAKYRNDPESVDQEKLKELYDNNLEAIDEYNGLLTPENKEKITKVQELIAQTKDLNYKKKGLIIDYIREAALSAILPIAPDPYPNNDNSAPILIPSAVLPVMFVILSATSSSLSSPSAYPLTNPLDPSSHISLERLTPALDILISGKAINSTRRGSMRTASPHASCIIPDGSSGLLSASSSAH